MKISEIITDKYKLRMPPTVYYDLLSDVLEAEEEQEPKTGHWIYTDYHTWCCSECGDNPHRGTGFVPNKDGMKMRWKYCNLCGAKMEVSDGTEI